MTTDTPSASSIKVHVCEHGQVHLFLYDEADECLGHASMSLQEWASVLDDVTDQARAMIDHDGIGVPEGTA
jgi:hypothetical protein